MRSACFWKIPDRMELVYQSKLLDDNRMANFRTAHSTVLRVPARQVQGHDRIGTVHFLSSEYVLNLNKRDLHRHVLGMSRELDVCNREHVERLLPVQHGLHSQGTVL